MNSKEIVLILVGAGAFAYAVKQAMPSNSIPIVPIPNTPAAREPIVISWPVAVPATPNESEKTPFPPNVGPLPGPVVGRSNAPQGASPPSMLQLSEQGANFIRRWEGLRLTVYNDAAGKPTIGYGHQLRSGENWQTITNDQANDLFAADIVRFVVAVKNNVRTWLRQNEFDALVSLAFNIGTDAFASSTLVRLLNNGDKQGAANQFQRWINAGRRPVTGLINRRNAERNLFVAGVY